MSERWVTMGSVHAFKYLAALSSLALLLGACSDSSSPAGPDARGTPSGEERTASPGGESGAEAKKPAKDKGQRARPRKPDARAGRGDAARPRSGKSRAARAPGGDERSSDYYPSAGRYTYAQTGYEEFCQQGTCSREQLPPVERVEARFEDRRPAETVVVTEARSSNGRVMRTTTRYEPSAAFITRVFMKVTYGTFSYSEEYTPEPPVESLRFPLEVGAAWSGSWEDTTSGDFTVNVVTRERVTAAGRDVNAFKIRTKSNFRGEFEGRADVVTWIDPETKAVVKVDGLLDVTSAFGGYRTEFKTQLLEGPGY